MRREGRGQGYKGGFKEGENQMGTTEARNARMGTEEKRGDVGYEVYKNKREPSGRGQWMWRLGGDG